MKLGEIKLEALMMIYPSEVFNVEFENLEEALFVLKANPNFADYLANMPGIINRCFSLLEQRGVLPTKQVELDVTQAEPIGPCLRYKLNEKIEDYSSLEKVVFINENHYEDSGFQRESSNTILVPQKTQGRYMFVYVPKIPRVNVITAESVDILPERDDIAGLIPYFVKSELLITEQAEDAKLSRSLFEQGLSELISHRDSYQGSVETIYSIT